MASPTGLAVQFPERSPQNRHAANVFQPAAVAGATEPTSSEAGRPVPSDRASARDRREPSYDGLALAFRLALDRIAPAIARASRAFMDKKAWFQFGFARLDDYAKEKLGRSGRWMRDFARLDRALQELPPLKDAFSGADGLHPIGQVAALAIGGIASAESVGEWIDLARRVPIRGLKLEIRHARQKGRDRPLSAGGFENESFPRAAGFQEADAARDPDKSCTVRLDLPAPIRVAFDEVLQLHRAVAGREGSARSFVEALVAEAYAGPDPPAAVVPPVGCSRDWAEIEASLFQSTNQWSHLCDRPDPWEMTPFEVLADVVELMRQAGAGDEVHLDRQIRRLVALEERLQSGLGQLLMLIGHERGFSKLGFANLAHYSEQRLGLSATSARDRVRVARRLQDFPLLRPAYERGKIGLQAASLVVRSIGSGPVPQELEREWVSRAERSTIKRLKDEVRALRLQLPGSWPARASKPLADEEWHASLRQEPGQIADRVRRLAAQAAEGQVLSERLLLRLPEDLACDFLATVESSCAALAWSVNQASEDRSEGDDDRSPPADNALRLARTFSKRVGHVPTWIGLVAMLEDFVNTWDDPDGMPKRAADPIYARDGWRCTAPGCTSRQKLESHHLEYKSRGGDKKAPSNQSTVCSFHHRQGEHGEYATCRGKAPLGMTWTLGRPDVAERYRNECRI